MMIDPHDMLASASISDSVLASIVTISADAIICIDESHRIIFFNEGAETVFGYTTEEAIGESLEMLLPERYRAKHSNHISNFGKSPVIARHMGERRQISGRRKNGEEFPAEAAISHLGSNGRQVYSVVLRDVTDRIRAHETQTFLAAAGEVLASSLGVDETLANITRLAVPGLADACIVNVYKGGVFVGAAVSHIDEQHGRELEQRRLEHPVDSSSRHPVAIVIRSLSSLVLSTAGDDNSRSELTDIFDATPSDGIILPLVARGNLLGVLSLYRKTRTYDPNDVFLAEELGRRSAMAIDNARLHDLVHTGVRARDDMIGIVSHDLRNPVNAVRMLTGVMLDSRRNELTAEVAEYATVIRQAVVQMDSLITDLLDVTRVEAGRLTVHAFPRNTEELLSDALRTLAPVALEKSIALKLDSTDDLPDVLADAERFSQALSNLVGNAIKFSPVEGTIVVRVSALDDEVLFSVADRGIGMTPDQLAHAFDRFWQSSRTDRQGAGLGLAIAKGIVDAHGGRIWAESKPDVGTTFCFTLPIAPPNKSGTL